MANLLRPLAPNLWVAERTFRTGAFDLLEIPTRMTVIRLRSGGLVLHSVVALDPPLRAELDALGPVLAVIAPNRAHHLFASDYPTGYPSALLFAAPGLPEKRPDLKFAQELSDEAPEVWRSELEQLVFGGVPLLNEVVFFHPASRTVIFTDLVFNLPKGRFSGPSGLFFRLIGADGHFGPHRLMRHFFLRDRAAAHESIERILRWDFSRVSLTHGDVLEQGGPDALRRAYAFLG